MLFETMLIILASGISVFAIGVPAFKLVKSVIPLKIDPVKEAKIRLDVAKKESEAARLNKEADELYEKMYQEALDESNETNKEKNKNEY